MDKRSKKLFNAHILAEAARKFGVAYEEVKKVGGFENLIYQFSREGQETILRISHSLHRNKTDMQAELDWIYYLAENGVSASKPVHSANGQLLETIDLGGSYFLVSAFEKAPGGKVTRENWNESLFYEWGRITGQMHRLTQSFEPSSENRRSPWYVDPLIYETVSYLPPDHEVVIEKYKDIVQRIKQLPQEKDSFGLIHTDLHHGNFFVHEGKITAFDFDDCSYQYFISDIAIPLFYSLRSTISGSDKKHFTSVFMKHFMQGYWSENDLDSAWLERMPEFLKLREFILYTVLHRSVGFDKLSESEKTYLLNTKEWIEKDVPYMKLTVPDLMVRK